MGTSVVKTVEVEFCQQCEWLSKWNLSYSMSSTVACTMILAWWDQFQTSDLQNSRITNLHCLKPLNLWSFVSEGLKKTNTNPHLKILILTLIFKTGKLIQTKSAFLTNTFSLFLTVLIDLNLWSFVLEGLKKLIQIPIWKY